MMNLLASFVKWASLPLWYLWAGLNGKSDIDLDITLFYSFAPTPFVLDHDNR